MLVWGAGAAYDGVILYAESAGAAGEEKANSQSSAFFLLSSSDRRSDGKRAFSLFLFEKLPLLGDHEEG